MSNMHEIIPAVLPKSLDDLKRQVGELPSSITFIHLDVLEEDVWDGEMVTQDFEVHLMVEDPEAIMARWIERGAKRVSIHTPSGAIAQYREQAEIGFAINLDKPLEEMEPFLEFVDFVHLMSIDEIGAQGHPFNEKVYARVAELQEKFPGLPISVDGGVSLDNYEKLLELGADRLIVGSHFKELWSRLEMDNVV